MPSQQAFEWMVELTRLRCKVLCLAAFLVFWFAVTSSLAVAAESTQQTAGFDVDVSTVGDEIIDLPERLSPKDVISGSAASQFTDSPSIEQGFNYGVRWLRVEMNPAWANSIILADPDYHSVEIFYLDHGAIDSVSAAMQTPVANRREKDGYLRIRMPAAAVSSPYLWFRTVGGLDPILIMTEAQADANKLERYTRSVAFAAFSIAIAASAVFIFAYLRVGSYGIYAIAMLILAVSELVSFGAAWEWLWPNASFDYSPLSDSLSWAFIVALACFARPFLGLTLTQWRILSSVTVISILGQTGSATFDPNGSSYLTDGQESIWVIIAPLCLLTFAVLRWRSGVKAGRFFAIGLGIFIALGLVNAYWNGTGMTVGIGSWSFEFGSVAFALFLQMALADSMLSEQTRRYAAEEGQRGLIATLETHNDAFKRFVPHEFLVQLERSDITTVRLGDHAEREMSVLFSDIRDFTKMAEGMQPKEVFEFLNSYLLEAGPIIRKHHGFIDKYAGDNIMALFSGSVDAAVNTSIALQHEVHNFNAKRARQLKRGIAIGVGIHCGPLILGTIGEAERFDTTVIANAVNVASRIEALCKVYGASILISGEVFTTLVDASSFNWRRIGKVIPRGGSHPIDLYEICDADAHEQILLKMDSRSTFDMAVAAFEAERYDLAIDQFEDILALNPGDKVSAAILNQARDRKASS